MYISPKQKKDMAFDVSTLTNYVDERRLDLIRKSVLGAKSINRLNVQTDVAYKAAINILDVDAPLQDGKDCGFNAQGNDKFSQRVITVAPLKVNQEFCAKTLLDKWNGYLVNVAANNPNIPFEEFITEGAVESVDRQVEKIIWQGSDDPEISGVTEILKAEASAVKVEFAAGTSAYDKIMKAYANIPVSILDKAAIFVGQDLFRDFIQGMVEKNYYHYTAGEGLQSEFILPATNTKVIATEGLNGTGKVVACDPKGIYVGTDLVNDREAFDLFFSKDSRTWKLVIEFVIGVQVAFPDQCVLGEDA